MTENRIKAAYRSATTKRVVGARPDGEVVAASDWTNDEEEAFARAVELSGMTNDDLDGVGWLLSIEERHYGAPNDGGKAGGEPEGDPEQGDGEPQPEQGEQDGDDDGEPGDGDGDGDEQGDNDNDQEEMEMPEMGEFEMPDMGDETTGNAMVDDIWEKIRPLVEARDVVSTIGGMTIVKDYIDQAVANIKVNAEPHPDRPDAPDVPAPAPLDLPTPKAPTGLRHHMYPKVLAAVQRGSDVLLSGEPGTGKSKMTEQIAEDLEIPYAVGSFTPYDTITKLRGFVDANGNVIDTEFKRLGIGGGIYCADEVDNASPATWTGMNSAMANRIFEFPEGMVKLHDDFRIVATANTFGTGPTAEFAGRQKMDPASLNRLVKFYIDTDEAMEDAIIHGMLGKAEGQKWLKRVRFVRRAVRDLRIKHFVTMRDSINGAKLIMPGAGAFTHIEALHHTVMAVLPEDQQDKIRAWKG